MIRITLNDLILFKYLFEEKYIHIDLVKKYLGSDYEESSYRRRLSKLKKNGYIEYKAFSMFKKHLIFPTKKALIVYDIKYEELKNEVKMRGNTFIKYHSPNKYNLKNNIDLNTLKKDKYLTELRFKMEDLGVDHWQRERMYYNKYKKNPDAIFEVNGNKYAIELETKTKDESYYKNVFIHYEKLEDIDFRNIIFVTTRDDIFDDLKKLMNNITVADIMTNNWQEKYRLSKTKDLIKKKRFNFYRTYQDKWVDSTEDLEKYIKRKTSK